MQALTTIGLDIAQSVFQVHGVDAAGNVIVRRQLKAPVGRNGVEQLLDVVADASDQRLPEIARACLLALGAQLRTLKVQILNFDRQIIAWHRSNEASKRLDEIPGVGPALATALVASVADPKAFRSGRNFSAWIGLVPKQHSSGGKDKLGSISKKGDRYLRSLFTAGVRDPWHQTSALAYGIAGAAANQGRRDRARQQDRKNGVGHDGRGRSLQGTRRTCGVTEIAPTSGVM
jgi:transposase